MLFSIARIYRGWLAVWKGREILGRAADRRRVHIVKPGYILLIVGGSLIAAGVIVSAFSVSFIVRQFPQETLRQQQPVSLAPGQALVAESAGVPASGGSRQYMVSIASEPADSALVAQVRNADGTVMQSYNVTASPFFATLAAPAGGKSLSLEVRNAGDKEARVTAGLLGMPFEQKEAVSYGVAVLAGAGLVIAGIAVAAAGAVKAVREKRKRRNSAPPPA
jgi:hypothetical protein